LSVVARARSHDAEVRQLARGALIEAYWRPVYTYLRLQWRLDPDSAADATQDFFVSLIERDLVARYQPDKARFRTYLRVCLDGFAGNQVKAGRRHKRGGHLSVVSLDFVAAEGDLPRFEPGTPADVDDLFYREWTRALLDRALAELRTRAEAQGRTVMFEAFALYALADDESSRPGYAEIARRLGLTTTMVTNYLALMRREFRAIALDLLRDITGSDDEWESEARRLLGGDW
jgi:RNA polymerase sigma factor (sigma-70 family)